MEVYRYTLDFMRGAPLFKAGGQHFTKPSVLGLSTVLSLILPLAAQAQVPNAGQALRDIEATQPVMSAPTDNLDLELPSVEQAAPASDPAGIRLQVRKFVIEGNQAFSTQVLLQLLADLPGKELDLAGLRAAAQRITAYYQAHGYVLARAFLPAQEIADGIVRLEVMEGRYGRIEVHNQSRIRDQAIGAPLSALDTDVALVGRDLERSLLLLSDLPGIKVNGTLRAGQQRGTTDLLVDIQPGPWASGSLEADNFGGYYSGEYRLGGSFNLNNPLRLGDQLSLRVLGSVGDQRYYRAAYQLPVGPWSSRIGLAYSEMSYALDKKPFKQLEMKGQARIQSLFLAQPIIRSRQFDLSAQLQFENKQLRDDIDLFDLSVDKRIELWTLGLGGSRQDSFQGGGYNQFNLAYGNGRMSFGEATARHSDRRTAGTEGGFAKASLQVARLQRLSDRFQLYAQINGQWASGNLDSTEKLSLGGPYGVRAYPQSAGSGDQGWQAGLELRYALAPRWQLSLMADKGYVQFNRQPWTHETNTQRLQSAGGGVRWFGDQQQLSVTAAWPLDQQKVGGGPERSPRVWANATQYF